GLAPGVGLPARSDDRKLPWYAQAITWRDTEAPTVVEATTPLPDGVYTLTSSVNWRQSTGPQMRHTAWVIEPEVQVDGDTEITIDLRELVPDTVSTDKPSEKVWWRSDEHTSELQSRENLVCRPLLENAASITGASRE